ncbi:hypothetical protein [Desulfosporosinus fructosivorans]
MIKFKVYHSAMGLPCNEILTTTPIDRLTHRADILNMNVESHRLKPEVEE